MNRREGISLSVVAIAAIVVALIIIIPPMLSRNQSSSPNIYSETDLEGIKRRVLEIGNDFIKESPTFMFDGMEETLELEELMIMATSPPQYILTYNFNSKYAGYGDRGGEAVADVITIHRAVVILNVEVLQNGTSIEIGAAHIDGRWNIIGQEFLTQKVLPGSGFLEGRVMIGPICPVQREGVPCVVSPEVYDARKIIVSDNAGIVIAVVDIDGQGFYRISLDPGFYMVDINKIGIDGSDDVPKDIEIRAGEGITLDINIDTGVR